MQIYGGAFVRPPIVALETARLTDPYGVPNKVRIECIKSACTEWETEPNPFELFAKERTRLPVNLHDRHARLLGAERDKVFLGGEHSAVEVSLGRRESAVCWERARYVIQPNSVRNVLHRVVRHFVLMSEA